MALHVAERIQDHDDSDCFVDIHAHILDITHWTPPCGWNLGYCLFKITTSGASFHITCPDIRLITDFLQYARPRSPEMLLTPARELIDSVVNLARKQAEQSRARIEIFSSNNLPPVMMDAEQMKQVLLNLILNAIDAMPRGGCLTINVDRRGDGLVIAVKDTGEGIDPAVRAKLFSPFVTTKTRGTGLGLAIAHRLVSQHGGRITAEDATDGGAVFQ